MTYEGPDERLLNLFIVNDIIIPVNSDCGIMISNLNDHKLFKHFKKLEGKFSTWSTFSIGGNSNRLAVFNVASDFVYDFMEALRIKYLTTFK